MMVKLASIEKFHHQDYLQSSTLTNNIQFRDFSQILFLRNIICILHNHLQFPIL